MVQPYTPLLEVLVQERREQLLREAERARLIRAAAAAARRGRRRAGGATRFVRACLYWVGAQLVSGGAALVEWSACNKPVRRPVQQGA